MSLEGVLTGWAQPPSATEQQKCENAERAIRNAVVNCSPLRGRSMSVFAQGSYRNRTNVRGDSDVDICVLCTDTILFDLPEGKRAADFNISTPAAYQYPEYKNDVHAALNSHFSSASVTRGNKAFDIHENTYRIDSDAVACFEYRRYWDDGTYREGTSFFCDSGERIINYPEQNYHNGVTKNDSTGRRFKGVVRILKRLCNEIAEQNISAARSVPSFLIESLVWNVPNDGFGHSTYTADVRYVLAHLFNNTRRSDDCDDWCEVNNCKYLFRPSQPWTMSQAHAFVSAAWDYLGFEG